jgi:hypothetical protein
VPGPGFAHHAVIGALSGFLAISEAKLTADSRHLSVAPAAACRSSVAAATNTDRMPTARSPVSSTASTASSCGPHHVFNLLQPIQHRHRHDPASLGVIESQGSTPQNENGAPAWSAGTPYVRHYRSTAASLARGAVSD